MFTGFEYSQYLDLMFGSWFCYDTIRVFSHQFVAQLKCSYYMWSNRKNLKYLLNIAKYIRLSLTNSVLT